MKTMQPESASITVRHTASFLGRLLPLFVICLLLPGCKHDTTASRESIDITGRYTLMTVDGNALPYTVTKEGGVVVRSGTFTINGDGTCVSEIAFALPSGAGSSKQVRATYTREGNKLSMRWQGAGRTTGTIAGNTFTMLNEGTSFAYRK